MGIKYNLKIIKSHYSNFILTNQRHNIIIFFLDIFDISSYRLNVVYTFLRLPYTVWIVNTTKQLIFSLVHFIIHEWYVI